MKQWLILILVVYFVLGTLYAMMNPLWEAPDEIHHFPMVQYLQSNGLNLPSQAQGTVGLWQQEGNQPPLYYLIGAVLISPFDTSAINQVMRVNPHADIGTIRPDGNVNRLVHVPNELGTPVGQATLLLRFYSLLLGAGTVILTYAIARELFPEQTLIAIGAAGFTAFLPMFLYLSAAVNNDNLSNFLASLILWLLLRLYALPVDAQKTAFKLYSAIGIATGAGLLAKLSIGFLIPLIALTLLIRAMRQRNWQSFVLGGVISGSLTIFIAAWWYWRNWQVYQDPTALNRFLEIVGKRVIPADFAQLWSERGSFITTFWGIFGSINVPMPELSYTLLNLLGGLALLSGAVYLLYQMVKKRDFRLFLVLAWLVITFFAVLRWTSITPASQGRLIYGAISTLALMAASGLVWWLPQRFRALTVFISVSILALWTGLQPFITIAPAYALAEQIPTRAAFAEFRYEDERIALLGSDLAMKSVQAGDYLLFSVDLAALTSFERDWSLFVHVVTEDEIIIGQRDIYPSRGLMATTDISAGRTWRNPLAVYIPPTTHTPQTVEIRLGVYHYPTGQRMTLGDGQAMLTLGTVELLPRASADNLPNPQAINFGNQIELIAYDLSATQANAGESIELTLYWRALGTIPRDYVVFANIIDTATLTKYAASNAMPAQWTRPTSTWQRDEIIEDKHNLTIAPDALAGVYQLEVGLYLQEDGFPRLGILGTYDNLIYLNPIRIGEGD